MRATVSLQHSAAKLLFLLLKLFCWSAPLLLLLMLLLLLLLLLCLVGFGGVAGEFRRGRLTSRKAEYAKRV